MMESVMKMFPLTVKHIAKDDGHIIFSQSTCMMPVGKRIAVAPVISIAEWEAEQLIYIVDMPEKPVTLEIKYRRVGL